MLIRVEDVEEMKGWSAVRFADWLRLGLLDLLSEAPSYSAFAPLHKLIIPTVPILEQIGQVYELLPSAARERFVEAIGIAASELPNSPAGVNAFQELVHLCGFIGAPKAMDRLVDRIADPLFLGAVDAEEARECYALLFNVAAGLTPAASAKHALMRLATSPQFKARTDPQYTTIAFDAFELRRVCEHRP